eukprot:TRINITY_DN25054_c0_g1_i1.p1 TRINITY_DN25054_c0_g1~~TRINITY_DN25054_c0_g1_i1.p1  ORF type:complete len:521 (+),score=143.87 TRINITY_DN25054_c0_g1_i1:95-1657(+)
MQRPAAGGAPRLRLRLRSLIAAAFAAGLLVLIAGHSSLYPQRRPVAAVPPRGGAGRPAPREQRRAETPPPSAAPTPPPPSAQPGSPSAVRFAHVCVVSTEDYVDGALVLGWTLSHNSRRVRDGSAELVMVLTRGAVAPDSVRRLRQSGWTRVFEVPGLAPRVPRAMWKDSFDKLYIFNLTSYEKLAFWDTDMLVRLDPDDLFDLELPDETWVYAIGSPPKPPAPPYFQTGMMVFNPSTKIRNAVWRMFSSQTLPKRPNGLYNRHSARDGALLRTYFGDRFKSLPKKYSRNMDPRARLDTEVALHYRGSWKPWYERLRQLEQRPNAPELSHKDFGYPYLAWWAAYEEMHAQLWARELWPEAPSGVSAATHVWMQRHTRTSYYQATTAHDAARRNLTVPGLGLRRGAPGQSCDAVCEAAGRRCYAAAFNFTLMGDCAVLLRALRGCERCAEGIYSRQRPGDAYPGLLRKDNTCRRNLLLDQRCRPACAAAHNETARLCPCLAQGADPQHIPWDGSLDIAPAG